MRIFRTVVVTVLLAAFVSPAVGLAAAGPRLPAAVRPLTAGAVTLANVAATGANAQPAQSGEAAQYAEREQQSQDLQNYKGGALYVYFGSGAALVLFIILLIILV
jgi:hypothetical protein